MQNKKKRVVIIGAGYGGLRAIERLGKRPDLDVILIDKNPYHYLQTEAYGYVAGRFDLHDVALDLKNWCHGFSKTVDFMQAFATSVDTGKKLVRTDNGEVSYDYLILATGAKTNFFSFITGLEEHSVGVKALPRAFQFRAAFEELLYKKVIHPNKAEVKNVNIAIGGAGLSGVEIAAEMADVIQKHTKSIGEAASEIHIYLIDAAKTILPGMSGYIIDKTVARLESLGVTIMTEAFIEKIDEEHIYFKEGEKLPYRFMVFTGGIKANTVSVDTPVSFSRIGQYVVDSHLQLAADVYAIGDCIEMKDKNGKLLPPTAQTAEKSAEYVAAGILKRIGGETPAPFHARVDGVFVALGGYYAVGEMFGFIKVRGRLAYLLKKLITKSYYLGLRLRLNIGFKKRTIEDAGK